MAETPQDRGWFVWNFDRAAGKDSRVFPEIAQAITEFEADHGAGKRGAQWLQVEAAKASSTSVTWLYYEAKSKRIEAFFTIRKAENLVETSVLSPDQPLELASEIVWLCKHSKAELHGKKIMGIATRKAVGLWSKYPAGSYVTVLLNPQGADTTKLREKYKGWKELPGRDLLVSRFKLRGEDSPPKAMGG